VNPYKSELEDLQQSVKIKPEKDEKLETELQDKK